MGYANSINPLWMNAAMGTGVDTLSILRDPWFIRASQAQNLSFKGNNSDYNYATAAAAANPTGSTQTVQTSVENGIPVVENLNQSSDSGIGAGTIMTVGALATIAAAGVAIKKGKLDKAGEAIKKFFSSSEVKLPTKPMKTYQFNLKNAEITCEGGKAVKVVARPDDIVIKDAAEIKKKIGTPTYCDRTGKLVEGTKLTEYTIKENHTVITEIDAVGSKAQMFEYKFVIDETGKPIKILKDGNVEAEGEEAIANFMSTPENKEVLKKVEDKVKAIKEGRFENFDELENVRYEQIIPDKNATYKMTVEGEQLIIRGELNTKMTAEEQKAWLHQHKDEYEKYLNELFENGRGEGIIRQQFLYTDPEGNQILVNELGKIESISIPQKYWWGGMKNSKILKKDSTEYHCWLQDHKSVEDEVNKIVNDGLATDSPQTIFRID